MKRFFVLAIVTGAAVWAQGQAQLQQADVAAKAKEALAKAQAEANAAAADKPEAAAQAPKMSLMALPRSTVVATMEGGEQVTAGMIQEFLRPLSAEMRQQALVQPEAFIARYCVMRKIAQTAEQDKLDQQEPWKGMIDNARLTVLYQAGIDRQFEATRIIPEDVQKVYDSNQDRFTQAKVKAIYVRFNIEPVSTKDDKGKPVPTEDEAKAKIEGLLKQARGGADFGKLARENSDDAASAAKDGDFGTIAKSQQGLPEPVRKAIFGAKAGEITEPVRQPNGFYIFRVEEIGKQPLDQVRPSIENELRQARLTEWFNSLQKNLDVKMVGQFSGSPSPAPSPKPATAK